MQHQSNFTQAESLDPVFTALLTATVAAGASDLHITVGIPPTARRDGELVRFSDTAPLTPLDTNQMIMSVLDERHQAVLAKHNQVDLSFGIRGLGRFRANAFYQRGSLAMAVRVVPSELRSLEALGAPPVSNEIIHRPYGLVLVTGPTGSGKSTTLAAMIDRINETKPCHILTIEDPLEFLHQHKMAIVNQREVGSDVPSFIDGLKSALREDPDVILLGEMRDMESIAIALSLAETGHLVFATLHTNDAPQTIDRIVDVFPAERRDQIQVQLASVLQCVISQRLVRASGGGRVAAFEVMVANDAVRNLIREGKSRQMRNIIVSGVGDGMQTLEMDLARLVVSGIISIEVAQSISAFPKDVLANTATHRSHMQGAATTAAGQSASNGAGARVGVR